MLQHNLKNSLGLTLLICLAACMGDKAPPLNTGLETIYKASVKFENTNHLIEMREGILSQQEDAALAAFLNMTGVTYADRMTLETSDVGNINKSRVAVDAVLSRLGLTVSNTAFSNSLKPGQARLVVTHASAVVPECGHFDRAVSPNWQNQTAANFGCASRSNLASMVANPSDLVSGTPLGSANAALIAKPIESWNAATQTGVAGSRVWSGTGPDPASKASQSQINTGGGKTGATGG